MSEPWEVVEGDCLAVLPTLEEGCAQVCVCSPPYFSLRDYGTGKWEGGEAGCDHKCTRPGSSGRNTLGPNGHLPLTNAANCPVPTYRDACGKCGARRVDSQLGLEDSPDCLGWATGSPCGACYVCRLVAVFRLVRRALRPDGTLWLNLGDSYAGSWGAQSHEPKGEGSLSGRQMAGMPRGGSRTGAVRQPGAKPKDLLGIPWRVALALQAEGWWLRADCVWAKLSPMPESVRDRPTRAHEFVFLFARGGRYFYDQDAERVPGKDPEDDARRMRQSWENGKGHKESSISATYTQGDVPRGPNPNGRNLWTHWRDIDPDERDLWDDLPGEPLKAAHFAAYPTRLAERCVKLGTSARGQCPACGAPWVRGVERTKRTRKRPNDLTKRTGAGGTGNHCPNTAAGVDVRTVGWRPSCACGAGDPVPQLVLDPFCGSGSTGVAARACGRRFLGVELSPEYCALSRRRIGGVSPLLDACDRAAAGAERTLFDSLATPEV